MWDLKFNNLSYKSLKKSSSSSVTEVLVGSDVKLSSIALDAEESNNYNYIINKIDTERLEVTLRLNSLGGSEYVVLGRNELTKDYAFFAQL